LDVTVIQNNAEFNLGIHKYKDNLYEPGGHKYVRDFESDPIPKLTYRVGGVVLTSEMVFAEEEDRILIRYTLEDAHSPTKLRFKPLLAFRNVHTLCKKNDYTDTSFTEIQNGIKCRLYEPYDYLHLQFSRKAKFIHSPDWYYGIEYSKEKSRGYEFKEDLYVPGTFELDIKKGESIIFSAGLEDAGKTRFDLLFNKEIKNRIPWSSFTNCLENAAQQFFVREKEDVKLIAGYHWFTVHGRDTFVALPGLTLPKGENTLFLKVIDTLMKNIQGEFFPSTIRGNSAEYKSVDASLWFFWALQQYIQFTGDKKTVWEKYGKIMKMIIEGYAKGTAHNIHMLENGLLYAGYEHDTLTWMNTRIYDKPVINRNGLAVEVNALWYNAIRFYVELAENFRSTRNINVWRTVLGKIELSFLETFWDGKAGYLADVVRGDFRDMAVRPNQLFVASLPYSPVTDDIKYLVLHKVQQELLTPRGIRTLSPKNPNYLGIYKGDIVARDKAYHQGSVFPWLFGHFAEGYLKLHGKSGLSFIKRYMKEFEHEISEGGIGTISELFYGDPPHSGRGSISHAWSVAELLRINHLINQLEKNTKQHS
jgi:predicted glycogen debranching enzyme